jgi:hypothetical protein
VRHHVNNTNASPKTLPTIISSSSGFLYSLGLFSMTEKSVAFVFLSQELEAKGK